jgi:hypothetical protein
MRLSPFNKANCVAMLNTLYPPALAHPPTPQLTATILGSQRAAFFRYVQAVERNGKAVLRNLENQSRRPQDQNGWPVVREIVDKYLRAANAIIEECLAVQGPDDLDVARAGKRADSGVGFASADRTPPVGRRPSAPPRPSTSHHGSHRSVDKPLPAQPGPPPPAAACPSTPKKSGSTLERIARELRRIKAKSADSKDAGDATLRQPVPAERKALKKMKSTSALARPGSSRRKESGHSRGTSGDQIRPFEIDDAHRRRLIQEARRGKEAGPSAAPAAPIGRQPSYELPARSDAPAELPVPETVIAELSA